MWSRFLSSCWLVTCVLVALCRASPVGDVIDNIHTLQDDAITLIRTVAVVRESKPPIDGAKAVHTRFDTVIKDLTKATDNINAISSPSIMQARHIQGTASTARGILFESVKAVTAQKDYLYQFPTVKELIMQDLNHFWGFHGAWAKFQDAISRLRSRATKDTNIDTALDAGMTGN